MTRSIRDVEGCHLTAADRRNILALLLDHAGFRFGETYTVNGRKRYTIEPAGGRYKVTIAETTRDNWAGEARESTARASFRVVAR